MYIPYGFIPDVETCRGASLPRDIFHATYFTRQVLHGRFYTIYLYPLHIYMYIHPNQQLPLPHLAPVTHRVATRKCHGYDPKLPYFCPISMALATGNPQGCDPDATNTTDQLPTKKISSPLIGVGDLWEI